MLYTFYVSKDHPVRDTFFTFLTIAFGFICVGVGISVARYLIDDKTTQTLVGGLGGAFTYIILLTLWGKLTDKLKNNHETAAMEKFADIPQISNEIFFNELFDKALKKSHIKTRIGAAALIDVPLNLMQKSDITVVQLNDLNNVRITRYLGNLEYVKTLLKNHNLFSSIQVTAQNWFKYYLSGGLFADKKTRFGILWNYDGDIIGMVAYWNENIDSTISEFLPLFVRSDLVATVPSDPAQPHYTFGALNNEGTKIDTHPYRYEESTGSMIEIKEFINNKWVKTAWFDMELGVMQLEKKKATPMTVQLAFELNFIGKTRKIINNADQR